MVARVARSAAGRRAVLASFRRDLGLDKLDALGDRTLGTLPLDNRPIAGRPPRAPAELAPAWEGTASWAPTLTVVAERLARGELSPRELLSHVLTQSDALARHTPSMSPIQDLSLERAEADAKAAEERVRSSERRPLEGVPVLVKEQIALVGCPQRAGTTFLPETPVTFDATVVARLRAAGAIVLGTTPMTEYGMNPLGVNPHRTMPRNPHDPTRVAGGSSTGSGVAVSTGLVPMAIGVDGGGSIRIPASTTGVFGIKPSWGRVSRHGDISTGTVEHVGPIGVSATDLALTLEAICGPDRQDPQTEMVSAWAPGALTRAMRSTVRGLRLGVLRAAWTHATREAEAGTDRALRALADEGAEIVDVDLALYDLAAPIGYATIGVATRAAIDEAFRTKRERMSSELAITMSALTSVSAVEYLRAQRARTALRVEVARLFSHVDALILPALAEHVASATDREMASGFIDADALQSVCRHMFLANVTGLPAAVAPLVGTGAPPAAIQVVGDAWDEGTTLRVVHALERLSCVRAEQPKVHVATPAWRS